MNKKILKFTIAIAVLTIAILVFNLLNTHKKRIGDLVFGEASEHFYNIKEVVVSSSDLTVTLQPDDGIWKVKEANSYYADYLTANAFFTSFKMAKFYQEVEKGKLNGTNIKIIDDKDKIIADVIIGEKISKDFVLVQNVGEDNIYMAVDTFDLPTELISWVQQPLMSIESPDVEQISVNGNILKREDASIMFPANVQRIFKINSFLYYEEVRKQGDVDLEIYPQHSQMSFITFDGLISTLDFYSNGEEYWVTKKISATKLPVKGINDYIKVNAPLYEGWVFKIPVHVGAFLFNSQI